MMHLIHLIYALCTDPGLDSTLCLFWPERQTYAMNAWREIADYIKERTTNGRSEGLPSTAKP